MVVPCKFWGQSIGLNALGGRFPAIPALPGTPPTWRLHLWILHQPVAGASAGSYRSPQALGLQGKPAIQPLAWLAGLAAEAGKLEMRGSWGTPC
jgi:hypothetical protein